VDEPLIFVEVALSREIPDAIAPILSVQRGGVEPEQGHDGDVLFDLQLQRGLAGVSFGNFLIKQVVQEISRGEPAAQDLRHLVASAQLCRAGSTASARPKLPGAFAGGSRRARRLDRQGWWQLPQVRDPMQEPCCAAAYIYLRAKNRRGRRRMPWRASISAMAPGSSGSTGSATAATTHQPVLRTDGNYLYDLDDIEKNQRGLCGGQRVVASSVVRRLLRALPPSWCRWRDNSGFPSIPAASFCAFIR